MPPTAPVRPAARRRTPRWPRPCGPPPGTAQRDPGPRHRGMGRMALGHGISMGSLRSGLYINTYIYIYIRICMYEYIYMYHCISI